MGSPIDYYSPLFKGDVVNPAIAKAANIAKTYGLALIKAKTPVDKGDLKAAWNAQLVGNGIKWKNDRHYAGYVEFGTKFMAARQMMSSSLIDIAVVFEEELGREIGKKVGQKLVADVEQPNYGNQSLGKVTGGLTSSKYSKTYLFSDPKKILSVSQENDIKAAKPLIKRR